MNPQRLVIILGLVALMATALTACGSDDDEPAVPDAGNGAVAPAPSTAFNTLSIALEGQGLVVSRLPRQSLQGAEAGVEIAGDKSGSARSFATGSEARRYADAASKDGDKVAVLGTVVFQADTQANADFFAQAYEG